MTDKSYKKGDVVLFEYVDNTDDDPTNHAPTTAPSSPAATSSLWSWATGEVLADWPSVHERLLQVKLLSLEGTAVDAAAAANAISLRSMVVEKREQATRQRVTTLNMARELSQRIADGEQKKRQLQRQLDDVLPQLTQANTALATMGSDALRELRSYATPPAMVKRVLDAVLSVLSEPANDWEVIKAFVKKDSFIPSVREFPPGSIKPEARQRVQRAFLNDPDSFNLNAARRASKAAGPLYEWVVAQVNCYDVMQRVVPLREEVAKIEAQADAYRRDIAAAAVQESDSIAALKDAKQKLRRAVEVPVVGTDGGPGSGQATRWRVDVTSTTTSTILETSVLRKLPTKLEGKTQVAVVPPWQSRPLPPPPPAVVDDNDDNKFLDGDDLPSVDDLDMDQVLAVAEAGAPPPRGPTEAEIAARVQSAVADAVAVESKRHAEELARVTAAAAATRTQSADMKEKELRAAAVATEAARKECDSLRQALERTKEQLNNALLAAATAKATTVAQPMTVPVQKAPTAHNGTQTDPVDNAGHVDPLADAAVVKRSHRASSPSMAAVGGEVFRPFTITAAAIRRHDLFTASFRVEKIVPNALLAGRKLKRVWRVHVCEGTFHNIDASTGKSTQSFAAKELIMVEKDVNNPFSLRLKFLGAERAHELLFESSYLRERFNEFCQFMRPGLVTFAPFLCDASVTNSSSLVTIDAEGSNAVNVETVNLQSGKPEAKAIVGQHVARCSSHVQQPLKIWVGTQHLGDGPLPSAKLFAEWLPKLAARANSEPDVIVVGAQHASGQQADGAWVHTVSGALDHNFASVDASRASLPGFLLVGSAAISTSTVIGVWARRQLIVAVSNAEGSKVQITPDGHGGCAVSFNMFETSFCFVCLSLPAWAAFSKKNQSSGNSEPIGASSSSAGTQGEESKNDSKNDADGDALEDVVIPVDAQGNRLVHKDQQMQYVLNTLFGGTDVELVSGSGDQPSATTRTARAASAVAGALPSWLGGTAGGGAAQLSAVTSAMVDCCCRYDHFVVFGLVGGALLHEDLASSPSRQGDGSTASAAVRGATASDSFDFQRHIATLGYAEVVEQYDPLTRHQQAAHLLAPFDEPTIAFAPTGFSRDGPGYFSRILARSNVVGSMRATQYICNENAATSEFLPVSAAYIVPVRRSALTTFWPSYEPLPRLIFTALRFEIHVSALVEADFELARSLATIRSGSSDKDAHFHSDGSPRVCSSPMLVLSSPVSPDCDVVDAEPRVASIVGSGDSASLLLDFGGTTLKSAARVATRGASSPTATASTSPVCLRFVTHVKEALESSRIVVTLLDRRQRSGQIASTAAASRLVASCAIGIDAWFSSHGDGEEQRVVGVLQRGSRAVGRCSVSMRWEKEDGTDVLVRGMW